MLLDNVSANGAKGLDGFYDELRRKYPNTFTLAPGLGKGTGNVAKLPQLDGPVPSIPVRASLGPPNQDIPPHTPHRWTQDGFLSKVQLQKSHSGQTQGARPVQHYAGPLIIKDSVIIVPSWNTREPSSGYQAPPVRLPNLRTQVEQNQVALRSRQHPQRPEAARPSESKATGNPPIRVGNKSQISESSPSGSRRQALNHTGSEGSDATEWTRTSPGSPDPLGTIMNELLPNKPGKLMDDSQKESKEPVRKNGSSQAQTEFSRGLSMYSPSPAKIFRPKILSPQAPPKPSDIIKKFSSKPKASCGPLKADHALGKRLQMQVLESVESVTIYSESTITTTSTRDQGKVSLRRPQSRVRFLDESFRAAENRYQERTLLGKREGHSMHLKAPHVPGGQPRLLNRPTEDIAKQRPPSPLAHGRAQISEQLALPDPQKTPNPLPRKAWNAPLRDIPTKPPIAQEGPDVLCMDERNHNLPYRPESTSLDGISVNFPTNSWEASSTQRVPGDHQKTVKEVSEMSYLYSKVKKTFHTGMQRIPPMGTVGFSRSSEDRSSTTNRRRLLYEAPEEQHTATNQPQTLSESKAEKANQEPARDGAHSRIPKCLSTGNHIPGSERSPISHDRPMTLDGTSGGGQSVQEVRPGCIPSPPDPKLGPLSRMLVMPTFLKKGREKNYRVLMPTPTPEDQYRKPQRDSSINPAHRTTQGTRAETAGQPNQWTEQLDNISLDTTNATSWGSQYRTGNKAT